MVRKPNQFRKLFMFLNSDNKINMYPENSPLNTPINLEQARKVLVNISRPMLRKLINEKRIRAHRIGSRYFFIPSELLEDAKRL